MKSKTSLLLPIFKIYLHTSQISIPTTPDQQLPTKFYVMSSRLKQLKNTFSRFGVPLWNALPENIKKSASRNLFKKQIHESCNFDQHSEISSFLSFLCVIILFCYFYLQFFIAAIIILIYYLLSTNNN